MKQKKALITLYFNVSFQLHDDNPNEFMFISSESRQIVPDQRFSIRHDATTSSYTLQVQATQVKIIPTLNSITSLLDISFFCKMKKYEAFFTESKMKEKVVSIKLFFSFILFFISILNSDNEIAGDWWRSLSM